MASIPVDFTTHPEARLPLSILIHYLAFLSRRPISKSNRHYLAKRLAGLQALAQSLRGTNSPDLDDAVELLARITPTNFDLLNERLQYLLLPFAPAIDQLPPGMIVSNEPPQSGVFQRAEKIALLCGPAIGIGDEIILFPLPGWIRAANPDASITVLSAYAGLWNDVRDVDAVARYDTYDDLLSILRNKSEFGPFDTVILADFERPALYPAVGFGHDAARDPERYVELSLGAQSLFVVDAEHRTLHRAVRPAPYFANFYTGFAEAARWLGLNPDESGRFRADGSGVVSHAAAPPPDQLRIYVSPFTSKYDPSPLYWSRLLGTLLKQLPGERPIHVVLDAGPSRVTERFAAEIVRATAPHLPDHCTVAVAQADDAERPGLLAAFTWIARAHVVICADSFSAHAAPLFGRLTCVVAAAGLENWRVPHRSSYYFSAGAPVDAMVASMACLIQEQTGLTAPAHAPILRRAEEQLVRLTHELDAQFQPWFQPGAHHDSGGGADDVAVERLLRTYAEFTTAYRDVAECLPEWPAALAPLAADHAYGALISDADDFAPALAVCSATDVVRHLYDRWQRWHESNVCKYLELLLDVPSPVDRSLVSEPGNR